MSASLYRRVMAPRITTARSLAKPAMVAAVALGSLSALMVPAAASAQNYGYQNNGYQQGYQNQGYQNQGQYYDRNTGRYYSTCDRQRQGRTGAGAVIGGGVGAVVGSQLAARGRRTEGSILGGVVGAVVGGSVGRSSSQSCDQRSGQYSYGNSSYGRSGYGQSGYNSSNGTYYDENGYGPYASGSTGYQDDSRYDHRSDRYRDQRGYDASANLQVSPDGYYVYDPNYGWRPR